MDGCGPRPNVRGLVGFFRSWSMGRVFATLADQAREKRAKAQRTRGAYANRQAKAIQDVTRERSPYGDLLGSVNGRIDKPTSRLLCAQFLRHLT